jgi:ribosomal protein L11 methyltransferase
MEAYLVVDIQVEPLPEGRDMLLAFLSEGGFDSFEETPTGLKAYILEKDWNPTMVTELELVQNGTLKLQFSTEKLDTINWNEEWERHYEPIQIGEAIYMRAPFHPAKENIQYDLIIEPKMSFGTGHHQTTRLMSLLLLELDVQGKEVLDMGTGTGVLAILAEKLGAEKVVAIDNFEWAVENTAENAARNGCSRIEALHGDAALLSGMNFTTILANINRNVLLEDMRVYVKCLDAGGHLALSGFFESDRVLLDEEAEALGLTPLKVLNEGHWAARLYQKL